MTKIFTPQVILKQKRNRLVAGLLLATLVTIGVYQLTTPVNSTATNVTTRTWETANDFSGTTNSVLVHDGFNSITLAYQNSTTDTTKNDFLLGYNQLNNTYTTAISETGDGEVILNQGWTYTTQTSPALSSNWIDAVMVDNDLMYVSTYLSGLSVIDTKGTVSPADDTFNFTYNTGSTPAIGNNNVYHTLVDNNLVYVSTWGGGLSVIDTKGTVSPADDTLHFNYDTGSTPAIGSDMLFKTEINGDFIYVNTLDGGLSVIDTKGTATTTDDTLLTTYNTGSTPAIGSNRVYQTTIDGDLLYISNSGGLSVIDTKGTATTTDDTLLTTYNTGSTPAISSNTVYQTTIDGDLVYVSNFGGLSVIDTKGTATTTDDTLVTTYNTGSTPAIGFDEVYKTITRGNYVYVGTPGSGVFVIDNQGTKNSNDDVLIATYRKDTSPAIGHDYISWYQGMYLDETNELLYLGSADAGVSVINLGQQYNSDASYQSLSFASTTPNTLISYDAELTPDHTISLQYRTGTGTAVWRDDFDDGDTSNVSDYYAWGGQFNTVDEIDGVLTMSDPQDSNWAAMWIDTGMPDNFFPAGSLITVRMRVNIADTSNYEDYIYTDNWEDISMYTAVTNRWIILHKVSTDSFSRIGSEPIFDNWQAGDTYEIDFIEISTPDSFGSWNSWSTSCTNQYSCPISPADLVNADWVQYRLNLTTSNPNTSPAISSVSFSDGYVSSGTFTSNQTNFDRGQELLTFNADISTNASTSIAFEYSLDEKDTWLSISPGDVFPEDSNTDHFTWRATLSTLDPNETPVINSVSITTTNILPKTSTSVATQQERLKKDGKYDEAEKLAERFGDNPRKRREYIQKETVRILEETITILRRIVEIEAEERRGEKKR